MKIGVMGMGVVGSAVADFHEAQGHSIYPYDIAHTNRDRELAQLDKHAELVFICVPTPTSTNGGLNCSAVWDALSKLDEGSKIVIIKSTVYVGATDHLATDYPDHGIFFVPEFLSEVTAREDYAHPKRRVIVGVPADGQVRGHNLLQLQSILPEHKDSPVYLSAKQAEFIKLATNAFYALKVTFANQMYDLGMDQEALYLLGQDPWIGDEHFRVYHKGYRGFGGACLPKDTRALAKLARQSGLPDALFEAALNYNDSLREADNAG